MLILNIVLEIICFESSIILNIDLTLRNVIFNGDILIARMDGCSVP